MENQHRKIAGYRELNEDEISLMNAIKAQGAELLKLQGKLVTMLQAQRIGKAVAAEHDDQAAIDEYERFKAAEPERWAAIGKTDIQTGIMAMVRAVAQPAGV
ncbi:hypothetical protein [Pseudomonas sp. SO81]|uniref:Acb2/Tad1 domain-containing protein n=1 Tax=Pseudomonas sp. SO81 TaxID=2983246 RepID=UPI0025A3D6DD|nr:hypothetical protein [Pseudomonas sp. SO81]WJN60904.1 Phage protein [Pseudomonas sp. SO81]